MRSDFNGNLERRQTPDDKRKAADSVGIPQDRDLIDYLPVTRERWPDLWELFEASATEELGNPSRCWCMELRLGDRARWQAQCKSPSEDNRRDMAAIIRSGNTPGILAYHAGEPVGWCSVSPREQLVGLDEAYRSQDADNSRVWSVVCFYVPEAQRGNGLILGLLRAAVGFAIDSGAQIVEGYPVTAEVVGDGAAGTVPIFAAAGFVEVASVNPQQCVMRYLLGR